MSGNFTLARVTRRLALATAMVTLGLQPWSVSAQGGASDADRPEPGLQGQTMPGEAGQIQAQSYRKGVQLVGHAPLGGRDSNLQLAWVDQCAYVSSTSPNFLMWGAKARPESFGVAVLDVSNPAAPKQVGLLRDRGSLYASETLHAVAAPGHKVLAAGSYGAKDDAAYTDIYDVSDCTRPRHMAEIKWPESVHTLTLSANGKHLYATIIAPFTGKGGIAVMDISDMAHPRYVGKFAATRPDGSSFEFAAHEISISPDEKRIYAGVISSMGNDLNKGVKIFPPNREGLGPDAGGVYILDNSDLAAGRSDPKMRLIGTAQHGGWHSVMRANIKGVPHLVGAGELLACPGSWPKITNIADERKPFVDGEVKLAMNHTENCPAWSATEKASTGISPDAGTATLHFNDVDSATDTRLGLFNFLWAGLRIVDIRSPAKPQEVAYFKPGDGCGGHVRYLPKTGDIWLACQASGFYVLRLKPEVRAAVGLPRLGVARKGR
ncbi:hypothetical protein LWE61_07940 [Sphingobium sufflavum]|uniref:LVIVD repeat-containing protein n=1 Tax=Sphingobium sufflavum TaxID=1129547 RepID=UPI001F1882F6|nr:hypothetical protein [Sphingobium sufflavum]MCE7796492.1 hypothetical protein [Sphingobium sufflavum]